VSEPQSRQAFVTQQCQAFLAAVQFLTRIPITLRPEPDDPERYHAALARGVIYFPLVGGLISGVTSLVIVLFLHLMPTELAIVVALAIEAMLTGAFHEDALADTCDALGGGWTRDQVLEILKDSRLGTYGTLGLGLGVACRFFAIVAIADFQWVWLGIASLLASGALGRWGIVWLMYSVRPVEDRKTMARDVASSHTGRKLVLGLLLGSPAIIPWLMLDAVAVLAAVALSAVVLLLYRWQLIRRVGGSTGDLLGCGAYLVQLAVLIVAASRITL
jgi:adenosylcobinamide-GDP ribazoletransferase